MASRRLPETIPFRGFGVCTVQTHWSRPGAILTAYSMCRCSISSPEGCSWEPSRFVDTDLAHLCGAGLCTIAQVFWTGQLYLRLDTTAYRLDLKRRSE